MKRRDDTEYHIDYGTERVVNIQLIKNPKDCRKLWSRDRSPLYRRTRSDPIVEILLFDNLDLYEQERVPELMYS